MKVLKINALFTLLVCVTLFSAMLPAQTYFYDNFESGLSKWAVSGADWDTTSVVSRGGDGHSITDSPDGNYPVNANSTITLANPIDLSTSTTPVLIFWHRYAVEPSYDRIYVEISEDGGFNWSQLHFTYGYVSTLFCVQLDLSDYKSSSVLIRFRLRANTDGYVYDGWYIDDVRIAEQNTSLTPFPFYDDFENGFGNWEISGMDWDTTSAVSRGGNGHSITDSPDGDYPVNANSTITLANPIDLSTSTTPVLIFWHRYAVEPSYDKIHVEISEDGGFNWSEVSTYTGYVTTLVSEQVNLTDYKSSPILIRFRLRANTDGYIYDGWYIDDVEIRDLANAWPVVNSFTADPTSGKVPLDVSFTCDATDPNGSIVEYYWDFDGNGTNDDTTASGTNSHIYNSPGTFNAICKAVDNDGAQKAASVEINVYADVTRQLALPDTSAAPGDTITIPITINNASGIAGAEFRITYDLSVLKAIEATTTSLSNGFALIDSVVNDTLAISMAGSAISTSSPGDLVDIKFVIDKDAVHTAVSNLVFDSLALYDQNTDPITASAQNGSVTVDTTLLPPNPSEEVVGLFITPVLDTLAISESSTFYAFTVMGDGDTVDTDVEWSFQNNVGTIGGIDPVSGHSTVFGATGGGDGWIIATKDTLTDTATVIVKAIKGDIDLDEKVNVKDAILCLQIIVELKKASPYESWAANYNDDKAINSGDVIGILHKSVERLLQKPTVLASQTGKASIYFIEIEDQSEDSICVSVRIGGRSDVCGSDLTISYNNDALNLNRIIFIKDGTYQANNKTDSATVKISCVNLNGLLQNKELLQLKFGKKGNFNIGQDIKMDTVTLFDPLGNIIEIDAETGIEEIIQVVPKEFQLHQNYPNPFNPSTSIRYELPKSAHVTLTIYNINGQLVNTLVNSVVQAGVHTVVWNSQNRYGQSIASGVYFCRLIIDNGSMAYIRKMIFLK